MMIDPTGLPPDVRQQLRQKTLEPLSDLGVEAWIDDRTDALVVDFTKVAGALGLDQAEAEETLWRDGMIGDLRRVPAEHLKPVQ